MAVTVVAASAQQPQPALAATSPLTFHFFNSSVADTLDLVTKKAGITVQFADDVTAQMKRKEITVDGTSVTLDEALSTIVKAAGLTYRVIDPKTVKIELPPAK